MTTKEEDRLTPEELDLLKTFKDEAVNIGLCTLPADWETAETAITRLYEHIKQPRPSFLRCTSPSDMVVKYAVVVNDLMTIAEVASWNEKKLAVPAALTKKMLDEAIRAVFEKDVHHGCFDAGWSSYYSFCQEVLAKRGKGFKADVSVILTLWKEITKSIAWWSAYEGLCLMCDRPSECSIDGTKMIFRDGHNFTEGRVGDKS